MVMRAFLIVLCFLACLTSVQAKPGLQVIVLGPDGGLLEGRLSAYLVAPVESDQYLALDAGSLLTGLRAAIGRGSFPPASLEGTLLRENLRGYLISHPHLDHVAGLVIASPEDSSKPLVGLAPTLEALREGLFNDKIWANFTDQGPHALGKYHLQSVTPATPFRVGDLPLELQAFPLSHAGGLSTAFLVSSQGVSLAYFGDTGPDSVEGGQRLLDVWTQLAPLVQKGELKAIMLEASFPDPRPDNQLYGHLTPRHLVKELHRLARLVDPQHESTALRGLVVVVTHIKPSLNSKISSRETIRQQLEALNDLGVQWVFPEAGEKLEFR